GNDMADTPKKILKKPKPKEGSEIKISDTILQKETKKSQKVGKGVEPAAENKAKDPTEEIKIESKQQTEESQSQSTVPHNRLDYEESTEQKSDKEQAKSVEQKRTEKEAPKALANKEVLNLTDDDPKDVDSELNVMLDEIVSQSKNNKGSEKSEESDRKDTVAESKGKKKVTTTNQRNKSWRKWTKKQ